MILPVHTPPPTSTFPQVHIIHHQISSQQSQSEKRSQVRMHSSAATALAALVLLISPSSQHSWVEEMDVIDPKTGLFTGTPGYCRNNTKRTVPGFSDPLMVHILPGQGQPSIEQRDTIPATDSTGITNNDKMCKMTQQTAYQADGSPRLQAAPGALVSLRYQENGHVTLPENQKGKPSNRGTVYIYGTTQPKFPELFLDVFGKWSADGTGGDRRGRLLATQPFDDGYCYQVNGGNISTTRQAEHPHEPDQLMGANVWCQNNIAIPTDAETGKPYVLYWVWDWPTEPGVDPNLPNGKAEIYTTCADVDIVAKPASKRRVKARQQPAPSAGGNLNSAAIPAYVHSLTASPAPTGASPVASAQQPSSASPNPAPTTPAAQPAAGSNPMASSGVAAYIETAVSAAIAAQVPKAPLTVTVDIVQSGVAGAAPAATQPAASNPAASPAPVAPANNQAAPQAPAPQPTGSPSTAAPVPSMPPKSLDINAPVLSGSPSFSGTASPVAASPATASPAMSAAPGAKGKRQCDAKTCKSKRQSRVFGKKSG